MALQCEAYIWVAQLYFASKVITTGISHNGIGSVPLAGSAAYDLSKELNKGIFWANVKVYGRRFHTVMPHDFAQWCYAQALFDTINGEAVTKNMRRNRFRTYHGSVSNYLDKPLYGSDRKIEAVICGKMYFEKLPDPRCQWNYPAFFAET